METPAVDRASIRSVCAKGVGEGTAKAAVVGLEPRGKVPATMTETVPSGFVTGSETSRSGLLSAEPVAMRAINLAYEGCGEVTKVAGSSAFAPGSATRSITLSLTMMDDMTTLVPPSRGPSGNKLASPGAKIGRAHV